MLIAAAAFGLGSAPVRAADDDAVRVQVEQRVRLAARLIADPAAAQRIASSGNPEAMANLDEGRVHQALAEDLLGRGDLAGARKAVDEALRHLGLARRLVPDAPARLAAARQRNEQLLASVERLLDAWRERAGKQPPDDGKELTNAMGLLGVARQQAQSGRYEEANQTLAQAERQVLAGMNRILHATTLDYTERASNPAEAFQQELVRHRGFVDLLPVAVRELKPAAEAQALIERYGETGRALEAQAVQHFQAGEAEQALLHLRNATLYVQRALMAAGLSTPAPTGTTP